MLHWTEDTPQPSAPKLCCLWLGIPEFAQELLSWASQVIGMGSVTHYQLLISEDNPSLHLCFPMQQQNRELRPWLQGTSLLGDT